MFFFWKTKDFITLYKYKRVLRNFKDFAVQTYKLIKIRTSLVLTYKFVIDHFKIFDKKSDYIGNIYKSSIFDFPDWFSEKIPVLFHFLNKHNFHAQINLLEIGSFEGRSSLFFFNYFKNKLSINNINLTCVDTWEGSNESFHEKINFNIVEKNFNKNIDTFANKINKYKCTSVKFFETKNPKQYDLIFIDGSHEFKDVLADAESSYKYIKKNGFIIFDDFNWFHYSDEKLNPAHAINIFLNDKINEFEIIFVGMILIIRKI
tara:strand:- start:382 stop:1164 length:783 start_codon:yes stop_codon:yes gene_type:complete